MQFRNTVYNAQGGVDMEINHPKFGWIPFTASPDDVEKHGRLLFTAAIEAGGIPPYAKPDKSTNHTDYTHTRRQFRDLLTSAQEAEIEDKIMARKTNGKRALWNWWNHTAVYEWDDREMVKVMTLVTPETAAAIEAAWIN